MTSTATARALLVLAVLGHGRPAGADAPPAATPIQVHFADGATVLLRDWTFVYEYGTWPSGSSPVQAATARQQSRELWLGKRRMAVEGGTVELRYTGPRATEIVVRDGQGTATTLKLEPPPRALLAPGADKNAGVGARALDLRGETLTGTRRELCIASFSPFVECEPAESDRVVKIEFHR